MLAVDTAAALPVRRGSGEVEGAEGDDSADGGAPRYAVPRGTRAKRCTCRTTRFGGTVARLKEKEPAKHSASFACVCVAPLRCGGLIPSMTYSALTFVAVILDCDPTLLSRVMHAWPRHVPGLSVTCRSCVPLRSSE
jgi:hypothetical protein